MQDLLVHYFQVEAKSKTRNCTTGSRDLYCLATLTVKVIELFSTTLTLTGPSLHLIVGGRMVSESAPAAPASSASVSAAVLVVKVLSGKQTLGGGGGGGRMKVGRGTGGGVIGSGLSTT